MDDARALLDSLMGDTRNAGKEERKKEKRNDTFTKESVCKYHLLGFCPQHEDLFHNTKRDLGECPKTHFEISKEEFDSHPDKERYQAEYEELLVRHLEGIVRRCDDWTVKEKQKNQAAIDKAMQEGGNEVARTEIGKLNEMASKLLEEAENLAEEGQMDASKAKVELANQLKEKATDWEAKAKTIPEVCEVCGLTKENNSGGEKANKFAHSAGKVHQGFLLIRKWHADTRAKVSKTDMEVACCSSKDKRDDRDRRREEESRDEEGSARKSDRQRGKDADESNRRADHPRDRDGARRNAGDRDDRDYGGGGSDRHRRDTKGRDANEDGRDDGRRRRYESDQKHREPHDDRRQDDRRRRREDVDADYSRSRRRL